jgi:hypothetical protein
MSVNASQLATNVVNLLSNLFVKVKVLHIRQLAGHPVNLNLNNNESLHANLVTQINIVLPPQIG